jgi:hypothetical protein
MATFYLDFEGGNDSNDGTTFANRWKTISNGATSARIAPGDEIRVMGSPPPTSLGVNSTWTSAPLQSSKSLTDATNATPISITIASHGYNTGDFVSVVGVAGNTAANGVWEITVVDSNTFTLNQSSGNGNRTAGGAVQLINDRLVKLATPLTANIASTGPNRSAWTSAGGANVVTSLNTSSRKEGAYSDSVAIAAAFTTGLAAYWPTGALDLSAYQQVSFWIQQTAGTIGAAGAINLRLCSDAAGTTAVNTISIPSVAATGRWMPMTVNLGTNLGSNIQSVALYVNTDNGAQTFLLNNIIACKASSANDSLTLNSLIGKNITGETWWAIQSINNTLVWLDENTNTTNFAGTRGYYGVSETVAAWKRETIKVGPFASTATTVNTIQDSGTDGSQIVFTGGWDRTNMSSKNLETWLDGVNGLGYGFSINSRNFINIENFALVRFFNGIVCSGNALRFNLIAASFMSASSGAIGISGANTALSLTIGHSVSVFGILSTDASAANGFNAEIILNHLANGTAPIYSYGVGRLKVSKGTGAGIIAKSGNGADLRSGIATFNDITFKDNQLSTFAGETRRSLIYLKDCVLDDATEFASLTSYGGLGKEVYSHNHDGVSGNHKIFHFAGLISAATDQRKTASGISWKMQPTSTTGVTSFNPLILSLTKVACAANSLVTVKAWMRRDNSGLTMRLICKGGQIAGVANDVIASVTTINDWEEETITFTPTETGVVEITAEAWGGTTHSGWIDDLTVSQA